MATELMPIVLGHLGSYQEMGGLSATEIYYSSRSWEVQDQDASRFSICGGPTLWFVKGAFSLCSHMVKGAGILGLFYKDLICCNLESSYSHSPSTH
jgi:hypothetical protein